MFTITLPPGTDRLIALQYTAGEPLDTPPLRQPVVARAIKAAQSWFKAHAAEYPGQTLALLQTHRVTGTCLEVLFIRKERRSLRQQLPRAA